MNEGKFEHGIEIVLSNPDSFNILRESLTRIGIASKSGKTLYQSVHILHKRGRYFLCSFKELFIIDGRENMMCDDDYRRRNSIAKLVVQWGLCKLVYPDDIDCIVPMTEIKVIPFKEKKDWTLISKYTIGNKK